MSKAVPTAGPGVGELAGARRRMAARGWAFAPAVSGPVGGGMVMLGHGSTRAAVVVALAPYALLLLVVAVFAVGFLAAIARYMWRTGDQCAMERMMNVSARAVVSVLTLTPPDLLPVRAGDGRLARAGGTERPGPHPGRAA